MNKHTLEDKTIIANQYIEEEHYWLTKLSRSPEKTVLPYGILEKGTGKSQKSEYHYKIQGQTFEKLMKLSKKTDAKLHMILVTGMVVLLNKLTDNEDILIGTTILRQETEANFLNTVLVLRNQVNQEMSLKELLMGVRKDLIKAIENQNYPVEALPYRLNHPDKDGEGFPLFDIALILKNFHDKEYLKNIQFNMLFEFDRQQNYIELSLEYSTQYYEKDQIEIYINCFEHILNELPERIDHQISKIEILKQEDREGLVNTLNQSSEETLRSMNKTLHQLFGEQVEKTPANIAIIENQGNQAARSITYQELNKDADQKAGYLQIQGVQRNCIVALEMQENIEMISRILGILKAGGAYLPIDPQYPEQRKQYILKDSAVKWVLRDEKIGTGKLNNSQVISEPHSLAYVIYTSGTTGKP
jgi:non-ribosomal peptide synthetase component F